MRPKRITKFMSLQIDRSERLAAGHRTHGWATRAAGWSAATLCLGTFRKWRDVCLESVMRFKSDIGEMTVSGAALDVNNPQDIPERFNLVFKTDGTHIPCHVIWRQEERIGVAFD